VPKIIEPIQLKATELWKTISDSVCWAYLQFRPSYFSIRSGWPDALG